MGSGVVKREGNDLLANHRAHRADHARLMPGGLENGFDQKTRSRLALGAGNADQLHAAGGISEKLLRHVGKRPTHALHLDLRAVKRQFPLHHQRRRAAFHGLRRQVVRVGVHAGNAEKQSSRGDLARICAQRDDFRLRVAGYFYLAGNCSRKRVELHLQ